MGEQETLIDLRERMVRIETKLDAQNGLREKVDSMENKATEAEQRSKSNTHRIDQLEANLTWLWRTIAGAVIAAGIAALAVFK
jgi:peptidoglycan hydrolase CwlO-like protein